MSHVVSSALHVIKISNKCNSSPCDHDDNSNIMVLKIIIIIATIMLAFDRFYDDDKNPLV